MVYTRCYRPAELSRVASAMDRATVHETIKWVKL